MKNKVWGILYGSFGAVLLEGAISFLFSFKDTVWKRKNSETLV